MLRHRWRGKLDHVAMRAGSAANSGMANRKTHVNFIFVKYLLLQRTVNCEPANCDLSSRPSRPGESPRPEYEARRRGGAPGSRSKRDAKRSWNQVVLRTDVAHHRRTGKYRHDRLNICHGDPRSVGHTEENRVLLNLLATTWRNIEHRNLPRERRTEQRTNKERASRNRRGVGHYDKTLILPSRQRRGGERRGDLRRSARFECDGTRTQPGDRRARLGGGRELEFSRRRSLRSQL